MKSKEQQPHIQSWGRSAWPFCSDLYLPTVVQHYYGDFPLPSPIFHFISLVFLNMLVWMLSEDSSKSRVSVHKHSNRSVPQRCVTLWDSMDCSPTRLLCPWNFPGKNTAVGCHFLLQGIFLIQGWNPRLLYWQSDSLPLSHLGRGDYIFFFFLIPREASFFKVFFFVCVTISKVFIEFGTMLFLFFIFWFFGHEACEILDPGIAHPLHWEKKP